jgi:hypothetical protein
MTSTSRSLRTRLDRLLGVPLGRLLAAHGQVGDHDVDLALLEDPDHVRRRTGRELDHLREVLADAVVRHAALDRHADVRHVHELERVVLAGPDRLGEVLADLRLVDVERGHELHVADVVVAQLDVHQARDEVARLRVLVVVAALDEAARAVAHADDGDADLLAANLGLVPVLAVLAHVLLLHAVGYPCSGVRAWLTVTTMRWTVVMVARTAMSPSDSSSARALSG